MEASAAVGWALIIAATAAAGLLIVHREAWRNAWLRNEDPRPLGLFRIVFGTLMLFNVNGMWELYAYLFTDDGLFPGEVARLVLAPSQFVGYTQGQGFEGLGAWLDWLAGPAYSPLLLDASPTTFWSVWALFECSCLCLIFGVRTRWTTWLTWFSFNALLQRNHVAWEGEDIYRTMSFYLCFSRCGVAYSVEPWLRRWIRRPSPQPRLSNRSTLEHIPAWPRLLMIVQLSLAYASNGWAKSGETWIAGDALLYVLQIDSITRFDPTWWVDAVGIGPLRLATWTVRGWEAWFPLVLLGLGLRHVQHFRLQLSARRRARALWCVLALASAGAYSLASKGALQVSTVVTWLALWGLGAWIHVRLRDRPWVIAIGSRLFVIDLAWLRRWLLGRRVWIGLGLAFHITLFALMNIGWFGLAHASVYLLFFSGEELARGGAHVRAWLRRERASLDVVVDRHQLVAVPEVASEPVLWFALLMAVGAVALALPSVAGFPWPHAYVVITTLVVWLGARPRAGHCLHVAVVAFVVFQCLAITVWLVPDVPATRAWRGAAREQFGGWLGMTQTQQTWRMFAPNAPRRTLDLHVQIESEPGVFIDVPSSMHELGAHEGLSVFYTRQWKINRRIAGEGSRNPSWYAIWHARYLCRAWALGHGGALPRAVIVSRSVRPSHDPQMWHRRREVRPRMQRLETANCVEEPFGGPTVEQLRRAGLPFVRDDSVATANTSWVQTRTEALLSRGASERYDGPWWSRLPWMMVLAGSMWARCRAARTNPLRGCDDSRANLDA